MREGQFLGSERSRWVAEHRRAIVNGGENPRRKLDEDKSRAGDHEGDGDEEPAPSPAKIARLRADQAQDEDEEIAR